MAPFTFHFSSILSSKFPSSSSRIFHNWPVFSHTFTRAIVRVSNTFGYPAIVSLIAIPWSIFVFISPVIFFRYGFLICLYRIPSAHLISIHELIKIESLLIHCHSSFFATLLKRLISIFMEPHFLASFLNCCLRAFSSSFTNSLLSKFQYLS